MLATCIRKRMHKPSVKYEFSVRVITLTVGYKMYPLAHSPRPVQYTLTVRKAHLKLTVGASSYVCVYPSISISFYGNGFSIILMIRQASLKIYFKLY